MRGKTKSLRKKILCSLGGIAALLILCGVIMIRLSDHPIQLRSDSPGVEFVTENGQITYVTVRGQFPYERVICPLENSDMQDSSGRVTEKISTYKMQAEASFFGQSMVTMRLKIETTDEMTHTYILKFADKDVKIVNGKVVE
ncbi:MAG: hypothetical protein K2O59_09310 [Lachnospiraceae bacterium]|nr:hypothetical protein [Lachnospiraceae bacterium]